MYKHAVLRILFVTRVVCRALHSLDVALASSGDVGHYFRKGVIAVDISIEQYHKYDAPYLQNPLEQRPVNQLLTVSGTDCCEPMKKVSRAEGLRHAASGDA